MVISPWLAGMGISLLSPVGADILLTQQESNFLAEWKESTAGVRPGLSIPRAK
jgi:hypothetical protein